MATYALIAKYRGKQAVYTRTIGEGGVLSSSERVAEDLASYAIAKKVAVQRGFVLVKSWREADELAAVEVQAETMTPGEPLEWKNKVNGWHRAKTDDGVYNIRRWFLREGEWVAGPADGSKVGATDDRMWRITFDTDEASQDVPWWKPDAELIHSLDHAKTSCQHHANALALSS